MNVRCLTIIHAEKKESLSSEGDFLLTTITVTDIFYYSKRNKREGDKNERQR